MKRTAFALLFALLWPLFAWAQEPVIGSGVFGGGGSACGGYKGPGDIVPSSVGFWGLRAYNCAWAQAGNNVVGLSRNSDNQHCNFAAALTGGIGLSTTTASGCASGLTYNQWAADATCTGTISGTTLSCTGASGTPHANSMISGTGLSTAGVVASWQISSCGTFTGGTGTCTINAGVPAVGSPETITMVYQSVVIRLYDQSGTGNDLQGSTPNAPTFFFPCIGALPCIYYNGGSGVNLVSVSAATLAQPFTVSDVADRQTTSNFQAVLSTGTSNAVVAGFNNAANSALMYAGTIVTKTANDNVLHAFQQAYNGASSVFNVDGVNSTVNPGAAGWASVTYEMGNNGATQFMTGPIAEAGVWGSALSTTQMNNLCHNQFTYWTTGVSC